MNKKVDFVDSIISELEYGFEVLLNDTKKSEKALPQMVNNQELTKNETKKSIRNIRVNHVGEVCAQALYRGQACFTEDEKTKKKLYIMCEEEHRHLELLNLRLEELKGNQSIFNPVWYTAAFLLGVYAGINEKNWKMGFIEETEKQVKEHLEEYIDLLPKKDIRSIAILKDVAKDEEKHRKTAQSLGSVELSKSTKLMMENFSKVMKKISYYF